MKQLERAYRWILVVPAVLPLVVWGGVIYPYLVPKTLLFYAVSLVLVAAFVVLVAHRTPFWWGRLTSPISWVPAFLLVLAYAASWHGIDFYRSFWSIFVRGDGLLMLTFAVASFYLFYVSATSKLVRRLHQAVASVGTVVAVYGIGEWLVSGGRIGSLLGNAAFFAGYLGITLFVTLLAAPSLPLFWRRAAYVGAAAQVVAIVLTATRGTILALLVSGVVLLAALTVKGSGSLRKWSGGALLTIGLFAGLFFAFRADLVHVPFSPIARIASISANDPDVASRLFIWKNMMHEIAARPLLGVGAEHVDVLFNQFYDPTQIQEQWFDRSHNAFIDYAVQYGLAGLFLYLALISGFFIAAWRRLKSGEDAHALLLVLLATTYAVQNFFVFDTISSFWLVLVVLAGELAVSQRGAAGGEVLPLESWTRPLSWGAALILLAFIYPVTILPMTAAYDLAHAYGYQLVDPAKSVTYLNEGYALNTYGNLEYGYEVYDMYVAQRAALSGDALAAAYQASATILAQNFRRFPYDARTALYLAHVLSLAPAGATPDQSLLSEVLARIIQESPKRSQPWYLLVNLAIGQANTYSVGSTGRVEGYTAAKDLLQRYIDFVPTLSEPRFVFAQLDLAMGDTKSAAEQAALGKQYYEPDLETARRAIAYYEGVKDWEDARTFLTDAVQLSSGDHSLLFDLAKVTFLTGDPRGAATLYEQLRATDPTMAASDPAFLSAITPYATAK